MHSYTRRGFLCASLAFPLLAGDNWNDKKSADWTDKDIRRLLTKSPWAKEVALEMGMDGGPGGPSGGGPDGPPPGGGGGMPSTIATVCWESALPIRIARRKEGESPAGQYVISLSGLPLPRGSAAQQMLDSLTESAELVRKGKDPIHAFSSKLEEGDSKRVTFTFDAGSQPIQMADREVVFRVQEGPMTILARFQMREMLYQGKLEL